MLEFIVLGKVPGTQMQLDVVTVLIGSTAIFCTLLLYVVGKRVWGRMIDAAREIMYLQQSSL